MQSRPAATESTSWIAPAVEVEAYVQFRGRTCRHSCDTNPTGPVEGRQIQGNLLDACRLQELRAGEKWLGQPLSGYLFASSMQLISILIAVVLPCSWRNELHAYTQ